MDAQLARESFGNHSTASSTVFDPLPNSVHSTRWVFLVTHQEALQGRHAHLAVRYSSCERRRELLSLFIDRFVGWIEVLEEIMCLFFGGVLEFNPDVGPPCWLAPRVAR